MIEKEQNNFDFSRDIKKYEKKLLTKLSNIQKKKYVTLNMDKINVLLSKSNNENIKMIIT
jgi:hypothetical protein